jgi:hypothetical protein
MTARRLVGSHVRGVLVPAAVIVVSFVVSVAPAFAAAPETPVNEKFKEVTATTAVVGGELNPAKTGEVGEYEFEFRVSGTECEGERFAPEPAGIAVGFKEEEEEVKLEGLQPHAKYTFCLVERNIAGEEAKGVPVSFETSAAPPAIESESFSSVNAGGARLEGVVNPNNQLSECKFQYGSEPLLAKETTSTVCEPGSFPAEYGGRGIGLNVGGLEANKTYYYRILASNATGVETGKIEHFTTAFPPETPEAKPANPIAATEATLHGVLNPASNHESEPGSAEFRYRESPSACQGGSPGEERAVGAEPTPAGPLVGYEGEKVEAKIGELQPGRQYTFCLIATNNAGEASAPSPPITFTTLGQAPTVEGDSSSEVSLTGATVSAHVDPGGLASTYRVEYGTSGAYASSTSAASLGDASVGVVATAHLSGLQPGTLYSFRFVVTNALGTTTDSEGATFTTQASAPASEPSSCPNEASRQGPSAVLPDCRAYEQVSPVNKGGAEDLFSTGNSSSSEGVPSVDGNQYLLFSPAALGEDGRGGYNTYLFSRGVDGWTRTSAAVPGVGVQSPYPELFDPADFSHIGVNDFLVSPGSETVEEYARDYLVGPAGGPYATVDHVPGIQAEANMVGGSAGLSHVVLETMHQQLAPGDSGQDPNSHALFEWAGGQYKLVNVNTDGSLTSPCGAVLGEGSGKGGSYRAVSSDGSKIIFTAPDPYAGGAGCWEGSVDPPQLYMRVDGTSTVDVSAPARDAKDPTPYPALYVGASADGEKVFFLSEGELTADATAHSRELYEYDTRTSKLTRVSRGDSGSAVGSVGFVPGVSSDGSAVYFTASGQLASGSPAGGGLYRYDTNSEVTTFITSRLPEDHPEGLENTGFWYGQMWGTGPRALTPRANWYTTAHGQYLAFASGPEVYLYNAASNKLVCVSCNPSGAATVYGAAFATSAFVTPSDTSPRPVSENGSYVFFGSGDALVPGALAGVSHVYEWHDGKISLISAAGDPSASFFMGSTADGSNVFFGTHSQLVAQDADEAGDLYDARINGGFGGLAPPACTGTGCQGVPGAPPIFATPASVTFAGIGNFASEPPPSKGTVRKKASKCKKGFSRKKGRCVKNKKSKKARKSVHSDRRASR